MLYISPVNEKICQNGFVTQVQQWASKTEGSNSVLAGQLKIDVDEIAKNWLPEDNEKANLTKGFRAKRRFVFGYNGNAEIAIYAKFTMKTTDVHLDWVVAKPEVCGRVDCGSGVAPLRSMLAFAAKIGQLQNLPVVLMADNPPLVPKYQESGWELTGRTEGNKPEMILSVPNLRRPSTAQYKGQTENVHWVFGGESTLQAYLADGRM